MWPRLTIGLAYVMLLLAGCGGPEPKPVSKAPACHTKTPPQAGECIKQIYAPKVGATPPTASGAPQGADISNWQPFLNLRSAKAYGIRFLIIQTNAGGFRNPFYWEQAAAARAAGLPFGTYTFLEPGMSGSEQARISASVRSGSGATLGMWADAEVGGSYERACPYVSTSRQYTPIVGVYSSNGLWPGYHCQGYDWPANWGGGRAYPLAGYTSSQTKVRQWCGTCYVPWYGSQIDRDESLGLLSLVTPPETNAQKRARLKRSLAAAVATRSVLRARIRHYRILIDRHRCRLDRQGHSHHVPHTHHQWGVCRGWIGHGNSAHAQGDAVNRRIRQLERELR